MTFDKGLKGVRGILFKNVSNEPAFCDKRNLKRLNMALMKEVVLILFSVSLSHMNFMNLQMISMYQKSWSLGIILIF